MKKAFFKSVCLVAAFSFIAIGMATNACDKTEIKCLVYQKADKKIDSEPARTAAYPDFILTNAIFRF